MSCNSCANAYSLFRKEKGCPACGYSYCSKCLNHKVFVTKLNREAMVCAKCKRATESKLCSEVTPPDVYYKRLNNDKRDNIDGFQANLNLVSSTAGKQIDKDQEILNRLRKLKEDSKAAKPSTAEEIESRLQKIKGEVPKTSDLELQERLAKLRGLPTSSTQSKAVFTSPDTRTESEQADELMKQYLEQVTIDSKYKDEFDSLVRDIDTRLSKLKASASGTQEGTPKSEDVLPSPDENEEEIIKKILAQVKAETLLDEDEISPSTNDELPFCEICNEDAAVRCLGCSYLFCKQCFMEHKDDDDGCTRYEPYKPPNKC